MAVGFQLGTVAAMVGCLGYRLCRLLVWVLSATTRTWARGVTTTYAYDPSGSLTNIVYSDATPDVAFAYDRLGRQVSAIVAGISTNAYTYDPETLALSMETQNGMEINRTTDAFGRDTGFSLAGSDYAVTYGFDAYGRFHSVTSSVQSAKSVAIYSYLPNSDLVAGMTASSGFLWTRAYEARRSLIASVENSFGETVISRYDYANDELGRRASRADSGLAFANPAFDAYAYNARSEVTGAQRYHGTDISDTSTVYGGRQFGYAYDPIGNRTSASETIGGQTLAKTYTANALNQYTAIANPDAVGLRGDATNTAVVTVNSEAVQRDAISSDTIPWHFALEADNTDGPDFPFAEIVAVINPPGTNTPDIVSTASGHLYAPPQSETLTYDDDGNLLSDGRWQYTWNGENRLIKAEELVSPTNRHPFTVEYAYDHQGRMVWKQFSTNAVVISTRTLIWDGYNIVRELSTDYGSPITTNAYVWGLDLSGSLQGAGGVGGLLAEIQDGKPYFAAFDANGNVTEYISTNGLTAAHYEYSPFGEIVVQSGDLADSFVHRFSTKPWCQVTGLSEYLFRKYSPGTGRWLSRDPIEEWGGQNLHTFVQNIPVTRYDWLGMFALDDNINGVPDCGVALYLTHTYNVGTIDVSGAMGCRRAGITSCYSATVIPGIEDQSNLIDIPLSDGVVGTTDTSDNGGYGSGMAGFIAYMKAVMLAAKGAAEGLCPPDHFLDDNEDNKKCKHDEPDCKCRTCDIYRATASGTYPDGHWLHYDSDTYDCCHCKKIMFKFIVPNSSDNQTFMDIISQSSGVWSTHIGIGNHGTRTYDCKKKTWGGGFGNGGLF